MNARFLIIILLNIVSATGVYAQNIPSTAGLPTDPMNGVVTYPPNLNASPNTNPTFYNYKREYRPLEPMQSIPAFNSTTGLPILVKTSYGDGLGNVLMGISRTNAGGDIVSPKYNRVSKTTVGYLPYIGGANIKIQLGAYATQKLYYQGNYSAEGATAYSKSVTGSDATTAAPVSKSYAPGKVYVGQERGSTQTTNIHEGSEIFKIALSGTVLCRSGYYAAGSLLEKTETSPHSETVTYMDRSNRIVCKKTYLASKTIKQYTYYIYNDIGKLIYIITPKAAALLIANTCLTATQMQQLCFSYQYNEYGNAIVKSTPGKNGLEYIVYDRFKRPVLVQNPLLSAQNKWQFTLYDNRGRAALAGIYTAGSDTRAILQDYIDNQVSNINTNMQGSLLYYIINPVTNSYPSSIPNAVFNTKNYYDSYTTGPAATTSYYTAYNAEFLTGGIAEMPTPYMFGRGKLVASEQRIINDNGVANNFQNSWITTVYYYDEKGRLIQTRTKNPWTKTPMIWDISATQYDFNNNVIYGVSLHQSWATNNKAATEIRVKNIFNAQSGQLEEVQQQMDAQPWQVLQKYTYDGFGKVIQKWIGGTEEQTYTYNISSKPTGINAAYINTPSSVFPPTMTYAETVSFEQGFSVPRYDGSISGFKWRTGGGWVSAYGYDYDQMGRMTKADFREFVSPGTWSKTSRDFSVSDLSYDANGNTLTMKQYGYNNSYQPALIDNFSYSYASNSNQLASVTDAGTASPIDDFNNTSASTANYQYDNDGNLASDDLKAINLAYNYQDLPLTITKGSDQIDNIYDAGGTLIQKKIIENGVTQIYRYWGPYVYRNDSLLYVLHPEGRCRWVDDTGVFRYDYFIKDHLGNVRTVVTTDAQSLSNYYLATHEIASANLEEQIFDNISDVRSPNPASEEGNVAAVRLNSIEPDKRIGTSLLVHVMAGDKINLQGYSFHEGKDPGTDDFVIPGDMLSSLISTLTTGHGGFGGGEGEYNEVVEHLFGKGNNYSTIYDQLRGEHTNPDHPRAYLNYLFFDKEYQLDYEMSGVMQVSGNASSWEQISTPDIPVKESGYLLVYVSNEQAQDVWFDNLAITYTKGRLLEENHYYPHGLLVKGTTATGVEKNKFKHQGKLLHDELGMQLYDFHARQYDPQIGRFWGIDPADQYPSGYTGMGNDPANMVDPSGMWTNPYYTGTNIVRPDGPLGYWATTEQARLAHVAFMTMLNMEASNGPDMLAMSSTSNLADGPMDWDEHGNMRTVQSEGDKSAEARRKFLNAKTKWIAQHQKDGELYEPTGSPGMVKTPDGRTISKEAAEAEKQDDKTLEAASKDYAAGQVPKGENRRPLPTGLSPVNDSNNPLRTSNGQPVYTLDQFTEFNEGLTYDQIVNQRESGGAGAGGPELRYVLNPNDGNIMDMRHVLVVGYGYGEQVGAVVEIAQWFDGDTRGSSFNQQDYYSNRIGDNFGNWYMSRSYQNEFGTGYPDFANSFSHYILNHNFNHR